MVMLAEALSVEREKRQQEAADAATRSEVGRAVLRALAQRLMAEPVPNWFFMLSGDEIVVANTKNGASSRHRVGSWIVDREMRLVFADQVTEWITAESCSRVVDEAVRITAQIIVDSELRSGGIAQPVIEQSAAR